MLLLNQQESADQVEKITGILFEMVNLLAEDLEAPPFVRAESGLVTIGGEAVPGIHQVFVGRISLRHPPSSHSHAPFLYPQPADVDYKPRVTKELPLNTQNSTPLGFSWDPGVLPQVNPGSTRRALPIYLPLNLIINFFISALHSWDFC